MRPILRRSSSYKDKVVHERHAEVKTPNIKMDMSPATKTIIPTKIAPAFEYAPASRVTMTEKKVDKYRKLKHTMRLMRKK